MRTKNPILQSISQWFENTFADPEALTLFMTLVLGLLVVEFFGGILLPVLLSVGIAYLLNALVQKFDAWKVPHMLSVVVVYLLFLGAFVYLLFGLLPMLGKQLSNLIHELPNAFTKSQAWVNELIKKYPAYFSSQQIAHFSDFFRGQTSQIGQFVLKFSLASIPNIIQVVLYLVLVPILVFFFLKDAKPIMAWFGGYMPKNPGLTMQVWNDVNDKIGVYIKGRVLEIIVIGLVSMAAFALLKLQYAVLLGALVGLSVIIPYVGAVLVTVPVVIVAIMQFGWSAHFAYVVIAYAIIITLDANLLVPFLFSETMDLHPIVIILAVIVFGSFWGFWGVFLAIPLATLVDAVLRMWPRKKNV